VQLALDAVGRTIVVGVLQLWQNRKPSTERNERKRARRAQKRGKGP
jgi:hypothetical protein